MDASKKVQYTSKGQATKDDYTDSSECEDELMDKIGEMNKNVVKIEEQMEKHPLIEKKVEAKKTLKDRAKNVLKTFGWLPTAREEDVRNFFSEEQGFKIVQIFFHDLSGFSRGACYVEFENEENVQNGLKKHKHHVGERHILVSRVKNYEMEHLMDHVRSNKAYKNVGFIYVSGFASKIAASDVVEFFGDIPIEKVVFGHDKVMGVNEAFIKLKNKNDEETVLAKNYFIRLGGSFVKIYRIDGAAFYTNAKNKEVISIVPSPKIEVKQWQAWIENAHKTLSIIEERIPKDDYIVHTYLANLGNYVNMFSQQFEKDDVVCQNLMKEIQLLKEQKH